MTALRANLKRAALFALALSLMGLGLGSLAVGPAAADSIAVLPTNALSLSDTRALVFGWSFSVTSPTEVRGLAYYDAGGDGLNESHQVAIFNASDGSTVVQGTLSSGAGDLLIQGFRVVPVGPITLPVGNYVIGGAQSGDADEFLFCPSPLAPDTCDGGVSAIPGVTYGGERETLENSAFEMPTIDNSADALAGMFGPSFASIDPVLTPAPAALIFLAAGVLGLGGAARLRSRRAR